MGGAHSATSQSPAVKRRQGPSNWVIPRSSSKRSSISSRVSRETRSVPNSSTLKEASTVP